MSRSYPSKLLLFGEHTVLYGSEALAIPIYNFSGKWAEGVDSYDMYKYMYAYYVWMKDNIAQIDLNAFYSDFKKEFTLHSNIPIGYGVGSSGVLCAAIFDRYYNGIPLGIEATKDFLGRMESYFHGSSSGLDPLISYLNKGIKINKDKSIIPIECTSVNKNFFVVDTGHTRRTSDLVALFKAKTTNVYFKNQIESVLFPLAADGIHNYLADNFSNTLEIIKEISAFQYKFLNEFILESDKYLWNQLLKENEIALKLCGAGGGGFMLGIAKDRERATEIIKRMKYPIHFLE
jgi:mevalonate kinase